MTNDSAPTLAVNAVLVTERLRCPETDPSMGEGAPVRPNRGWLPGGPESMTFFTWRSTAAVAERIATSCSRFTLAAARASRCWTFEAPVTVTEMEAMSQHPRVGPENHAHVLGHRLVEEADGLPSHPDRRPAAGLLVAAPP